MLTSRLSRPSYCLVSLVSFQIWRGLKDYAPALPSLPLPLDFLSLPELADSFPVFDLPSMHLSLEAPQPSPRLSEEVHLPALRQECGLRLGSSFPQSRSSFPFWALGPKFAQCCRDAAVKTCSNNDRPSTAV